MSNKNRVVTKNAIAEHLSGDDAEIFDNFDFIYAHMKNLKKKLGEARCPDYIKTIYGLGYKFEAWNFWRAPYAIMFCFLHCCC